ncbi:hypothetical protein JGU71_19065 [Antrihabitans sp. YC3-6]|uniref:Uncharacterized protein n=1 Tax=Antrihabitans stalagmiti TaxID=2799499 RepID=A0A934NT36_9NOCA|nr:hypothetical protein [Antrihabitans stalagmiti]MBJ8340991.1 hypothetical protein [Antrihabitans stalagmiti]
MHVNATFSAQGDPARPDLALCIIEAVQSATTDTSDTAVILDRYQAYRQAQGQQARADGVRALLRTFEEVGSCDAWAGKVGNYRRRYSPTSAPIAATAIEHAAELFYAHHIDSIDDLASARRDDEILRELELGLEAIAGQRGTLYDLLELAGLDRQLALVSA